MSFVDDSNNPYASFGRTIAADAPTNVRAEFIGRVYLHIGLAVLAFIGLEVAIFSLLPVEQIVQGMLGSRWVWLGVLVGFMAVSYISHSLAVSNSSLATQYAGLGLYVVGQSVIFIPLLYIASQVEGVLSTATFLTLLTFGGLTAIVFVTRANFSWMGPMLGVAGIIAMGLVIAMLFGVGIPALAVIGFMLVFISGMILYQTSNVLHEYHTDQYVAAALGLFASLMTMLWYMIQLVLSFSGDD